jgi:hypothetical protein
MIAEFPHKAPKGYSYEFEVFNTRTTAIWLCCQRKFDYNMGKPTRTIWGFYSPKKNCYYAPINATKQGDEVNIEDTRSYTAMQIKRTALEECFV